MNRQRRAVILTTIVAMSAAPFLGGCLLVRTTEHRIKLNDNGGGEAFIRLIDIRSDAANDSTRLRDYGMMMASVALEGGKEFEKAGRKVLSKQFQVNGDTLNAEITYSFSSIDALEVLKQVNEEYFVVVNEGREIIKTNGKIKPWEGRTQRIVWPKETKRLMYQIREKVMPPSTSLASLYVRYDAGKPGGEK
jgi:hypothetical protein